MGLFISSFGLQRPEDLSSQLEAAGCGACHFEKKNRFRTYFWLQYVARCISYIYIYIIDNYYSML